ncbi:telomere binding protein [Linnemannia zychae]|nr:telomere binding protein [Linnemannia zychae]
MTDARDSEAISIYLSDLQGQVRASSPSLSTIIRVLAEPLSFLGFLPAQQQQQPFSTNETPLDSLPSWSGPIKPTATRRLYFIQHLLPNHLEFILDNITIDWLSALPSIEQTMLFDTISNALGTSNQFPGHTTAKTDLEKCFQETYFFDWQAIQLQECISTLSNLETEEKKIRSKAFGIIIAKFLRLGFGGTLVKLLMSILWGASSQADSLGWRMALTAFNSTTAQTFLTALIEYLNKNNLESSRIYPSVDKSIDKSQNEVHTAAHLLFSLGYGVGGESNSMIEEILFQGRVYGLGVLRALICIQSGWPQDVASSKDSVLAHTFMRTLTIWSDTMLVKHASIEYQKYICYQLLLMIGYFNTTTLLELNAISIFGNGVGEWLDLEVFKRKQIGLIVAEEFSKAVDTIGSPADFELDSTNPDVKFARSLVKIKDGACSYQPHTQESNQGALASEEKRAKTVHGFDIVQNTAHVSEMDDSDDDEDPDATAESFSRSHRQLSDDESDDESDDLKPYEMDYESDPDEDTGTFKKSKVAPPLYLRDLIIYIRSDEDREKTEIGLKSAVELIRRKSGSLELEEHSADLTTSLVHLQDTFDTPGFYKLRESALVALVVTSPVIVSGVLTYQFYEKNNSLGQRLNILNALAIGAQELSGFNQPSFPLSKGSRDKSGNESTTASTSSGSTNLTTQRKTFDSITSAISLSKTRRFSQKSNIAASSPLPKANKFANLAPLFLGGLLGRWGGNRGAGVERGYDVLQRAPVMLLKKFVVTLGVIVHYSGNTPHLLLMTKELFQFLLALRYYTPPNQPSPSSFGGIKVHLPTVDSFSSMLSEKNLTTPTITSLKLPGDAGASNIASTSAISTGAPFDADLVESLLFDLLILVTPASGALSDDLLLSEFYVEIVETQQWAMELWDSQKLEQGSNDKARVYGAALLQRCFELMKVSM